MQSTRQETITQAEAARRYGVSHKTIRKWRSAGLVRSSAIGSRLVLIRVEDVERLLASGIPSAA